MAIGGRNGNPQQYPMLIGGEWKGAFSGEFFDVVNPANTAEVVGRVPKGDGSDARHAIDAAVRAFDEWKLTPVYERASLLKRAYNMIIERVEDLGRTIHRENGKPLAEACDEVRFGARYLDWFAEEVKRAYGALIPPANPNKRLMVVNQPVGVVAAITPWNFPATMVLRKLAPALASGCTVVLKPAEQTPITALMLARILDEAGFPPGVVNVVTGDPVAIGKELLEDSRVRKITFTGSTAVGKLLMARSADSLKRVTLELGGHAPFIVFRDADVEKAVKSAVAIKFKRAAGQSCICINRIYLHEEIHAEFTEAFVEEVKSLKVVGVGIETGDLGPLIDAQALAKVEDHVRDALDRGAKIACGGHRLTETPYDLGSFYAPTVLVGVRDEMKICKEETFGPVAPILTFKDESEVVQRANNNEYGLAAYVFTKDVSRALRVAEQLECGVVGVNDASPQTPEAPFGGVKMSGIGREGGREGLEEYLERKLISIDL